MTNTKLTANEVIKLLDLVPLPEEGGFYRETFRSSRYIPRTALPYHKGDRCYSTLIFYLVTPEEFSGLHRVVGSDEIFHFYLGDPVELVKLHEDGPCERFILGQDIANHQQLQCVVKSGVWQGTRLVGDGQWALLGCSVAPGFEFEDFEIKTRQEFLDLFPQYTEVVLRYTRP